MTVDRCHSSTCQGQDTQKHLSSTYLSAVQVTAGKTTYFIESVYSKAPTMLNFDISSTYILSLL